MKPIPGEGAKRREIEIYRLAHFVAMNRGCSASEVMLGAEAISATCRTSYYYHLDEAIKKGWIEKTGNTRGTRYNASPEFLHKVTLASLGQPVSTREKVSYNEDFLGSYQPNETYYLSESQRQALHGSCALGSFNANDERVSKEIRRFMADLTHNSSAFEGVDVKYADTITFLEQNIESRHMSPNDAVILRNHYNAIRFIVENTRYPAQPGDIEVSEYDTRNIHSFLSDGLLKDRRQQGRLRNTHVEIRDSCYIPNDIPDTIKREFTHLLNKAAQIHDPYEQSVFLLVHIPYLQPFDDCNKRTARLVCNIPLLRSGILPVSWAEVNHRDYTDSLMCVYEKNSTFGICEVFVEACKRSFERFEISQKTRDVSRMEITHAIHIKDAVRKRILHDDKSLPRDVDPLLIGAFEAHVEGILEDIRVNDMVAGPYRLRPTEVQAWVDREKLAPASTDAPR